MGSPKRSGVGNGEPADLRQRRGHVKDRKQRRAYRAPSWTSTTSNSPGP